MFMFACLYVCAYKYVYYLNIRRVKTINGINGYNFFAEIHFKNHQNDPADIGVWETAWKSLAWKSCRY